jgi:protein phosphatase
VDDNHLGSAVKCGKCRKAFAVRPPGPAKGPPKPPSDEELQLVLDGPAAAALASPVPAGSQAKPLAPAALPSVCCVDVAGATSPGKTRTRNEDSFLAQHLSWSNLDERHEVALVVVADGMGGHEAGELASGLAVRTIGGALTGLIVGAATGTKPATPPASVAGIVTGVIKEANRAVFSQGQTQPAWRGMGATAAVVLVWDGQAIIGHIGDCRVYRYSGEELTQVTRDQTLVARMVELGQLSPREALTHPSRNEVTQAIGRHADITPSSTTLHLAGGDWLIAACDGLHAHVDARALEDAVRVSAPSAFYLAHHLVDLANQGGGSDNCTVVAIRCC